MAKQAFFIGIKGVGMTSLALAMQDAGWTVSGSDTQESFITDKVLIQRGISVTTPLDSPIPLGTDRVIYSGAYDPKSLKSFRSNLQSLTLAEALAEFVTDRQVIAVAGVGGKTTTSAMLAALFHAAGRDVGYYVGTGSIAGLPAPGHAGTDPIFIVEADEYAISRTDPRPKFALLSPRILITTNIVHDHPDIYPNQMSTLAAFQNLVDRLPANGTWVACDTDPLTQQLLRGDSPKCHILTYNLDHPLFAQLDLQVFGDQNRLDAVAAVLAATSTGIPEKLALRAIHSYAGAGRRQEFHGEVAGRLLYDDYGHHPQEVELTVRSFKEHFPNRRLLLVFESHTYSRTEALLPEFAHAIALADLPFIMPIFESAREQGSPHQITPATFASTVAQHNPHVVSLTWDNAATTVWSASRPGDLILTMGAGFVYKLHEQFVKMVN